MQKFLFLSAIAATMGVMASCSEDEIFSPTVVDSNAIAFATRSAQPSTRSAVTINSIDKFTVSAVDDENTPFFNNEEFIFNPSANVFTSVTPHYWPTTGTLSFYAISDPGHRTVDEANVPKYTYENWAAEKDLVAATVKAGEKQIPYPLIFKHLTSQIYVSAEAEDKTEELTYKLISVKMTAPSYGTYNFADATGGVGTWDIDKSKTSEYSYDDALPMTFRHHGQIELSSCYWNILPVAEGEILFDVEYQVLQNGRIIADFTGTNAKECIASSQTLLSGKRYIYNFILTCGSDETITFSVNIEDWEGSDDRINPDFTEPLQTKTVDMGVPGSNLKWAAGNIGAKSETDPGLYFQWGEVSGHADDGTFTYRPGGYNRDDDYNAAFGTQMFDLTLEQDAARVNLGGNWRMPTKQEFDDLLAACTYEFTQDYNNTGVAGCILTSKANGNKLFFPQNKDLGGTEVAIGASVSLWTSTFGSFAFYYYTSISFFAGGFDDDCRTGETSRCYAFPIRAVCE